MFTSYSDVCMAVACNLSGVHNYWLPERNLSYITLDGNELIFYSHQEKFQVLGHASVEWNEEHFIDVDETGKVLAGEILKQLREYEKDGKAIICAKAWLAETDAFAAKSYQWIKELWIDDIKKLEIERWSNFFETQENPIFQDLAEFLKCHLDQDREAKSRPDRLHFRELLESEIGAANKLTKFLGNHSNEVLREGAEWIPQWMKDH